MRRSHPRTQTKPRCAMLGRTAVIVALGVGAMPAQAVGAPTLWGYGVKTCPQFVAAAPADGAANALTGGDYPRYREWLAGMVSGLNLATGSDVLRGAELDAALGRIRAHCKDHPKDDFFNASLALFKSLGTGGE